VVEQSPLQDGRNMTMLLAPSKAVLAADKERESENGATAGPDGATPQLAETTPRDVPASA
ncbi:MAG: hypothetical protein JOZ64_08935, partial [Solirubrobacterales bacterium]|nr:hypothetical protein [Solirubrobacterales bacterium]